jgi:hypothetical protein
MATHSVDRQSAATGNSTRAQARSGKDERMMVLRLPPRHIGALAALAAAGVLGATALLTAQTAPVLQPATVVGPNVTLTWSNVGATSYRLAAGVASNAYQLSVNVGSVNTIDVAAPAVGTYYVRVYAVFGSGEVASNEIALTVTSMFVPPTAPTNLAGYLNGTTVVLDWALGAGGGAPAGLLMHVGSAPGGTQVGQFPLPVGSQFAAANVPPGTYYIRLYAGNGGGFSPASNEIQLVMPAGGGCTAPPQRAFKPSIYANFVQLSWTAVPGATQQLDFTTSPGGAPTLSVPVAPNVSSQSFRGAPYGTFYGKLTSGWSCGATTGPEVTLVVDGSPPPGPRTPNPAPGQQLPLPGYGASVIAQLAAERPDLMRASCRETGGNNRFLFEGVRRLRTRDTRWGLNWKRGNRGDMSQDIVNYNYGSGPDEDTQSTYIVDVIGGHCGPNPGPSWIDVTGATRNAGTIGIWTLIPYVEAGYPISPDQPQQ